MDKVVEINGPIVSLAVVNVVLFAVVDAASVMDEEVLVLAVIASATVVID